MKAYYFEPGNYTLDGEDVRRILGIRPTASTSVSTLNAAKIYPVNRTPNPYDANYYTVAVSYVINGTVADIVYTPTALPLAEAQEIAKGMEKTRANKNSRALSKSSGYIREAVAAVAFQDPADRDPALTKTVTLMAGTMTRLKDNLASIDAATSVTDLAAITDAPDFVINTGRSGTGSNEMNPTYFPTINMVGVAESDLELYVPSIDLVLSYDAGLPAPYKFDMNGALFNEDFKVEVRIAATSTVVACVTVPDTGATNVDIDLYVKDIYVEEEIFNFDGAY